MSTYVNLLSQFQKLRRHNRQGSYKTRERYGAGFVRFLRYVGETYRLEKLANISGKHISSYVEYMRNKNYSAATIKVELCAIRFWHDQVPNAKYSLPSNDELNLERRKFGGVDRTWSNPEFARMIGECWKAGREDYVAIICLARYAGLRIHECFRVDTASAEHAVRTMQITIKGKNGKIRTVPIQESIRIGRQIRISKQAVTEYLIEQIKT